MCLLSLRNTHNVTVSVITSVGHTDNNIIIVIVIVRHTDMKFYYQCGTVGY